LNKNQIGNKLPSHLKALLDMKACEQQSNFECHTAALSHHALMKVAFACTFSILIIFLYFALIVPSCH